MSLSFIVFFVRDNFFVSSFSLVNCSAKKSLLDIVFWTWVWEWKVLLLLLLLLSLSMRHKNTTTDRQQREKKKRNSHFRVIFGFHWQATFGKLATVYPSVRLSVCLFLAAASWVCRNKQTHKQSARQTIAKFVEVSRQSQTFGHWLCLFVCLLRICGAVSTLISLHWTFVLLSLTCIGRLCLLFVVCWLTVGLKSRG